MSYLLPGVKQLVWRSLAAASTTPSPAAQWICTAAVTAASKHCRQYSSTWVHSALPNLQQLEQQPQQLPHHQQPSVWQRQQLVCRMQMAQQWATTSSSSSRVMSTWAGLGGMQRHSTTILCVRKGSEVVIIGDGQATQNDFIVKPNVCKVRRIGTSAVGGFAGVAVDGLALLEKLEAKLEEHPGQLLRASVELAKMWRQDKLLRELDASLIVADSTTTLWLMGNGDVLEPGEDGVLSIGSGADFAESAARALLQLQRDQQQESNEQQQQGGVEGAAADTAAAVNNMSLFEIAKASMKIAADCCVYTNSNFSWHHIQSDGTIESGSSVHVPGAAKAEPADVK